MPFDLALCFHYKLVLALTPLEGSWFDSKYTLFLFKWCQIVPVMSCSQSKVSEAGTNVDSTDAEAQEGSEGSVKHRIYSTSCLTI